MERETTHMIIPAGHVLIKGLEDASLLPLFQRFGDDGDALLLVDGWVGVA